MARRIFFHRAIVSPTRWRDVGTTVYFDVEPTEDLQCWRDVWRQRRSNLSFPRCSNVVTSRWPDVFIFHRAVVRPTRWRDVGTTDYFHVGPTEDLKRRPNLYFPPLFRRRQQTLVRRIFFHRATVWPTRWRDVGTTDYFHVGPTEDLKRWPDGFFSTMPS